MKPQRDPRALLIQVATAGGNIPTFTSGKTFADYSRDHILRSAVERQFMIIGEALREASKLDASLERRITNFRAIIDFRNVLVHGYATVFDAGVWDITETTSPPPRRGPRDAGEQERL